MKSVAIVFGVFLFFSAAVLAGSDQSRTAVDQWQFRVLLGEKPIGHYSVTLNKQNQRTIVSIKARMDVKFLFFNAFSYRHVNTEVWKNGCLVSITSVTRKNSKRTYVNGNIGSGGLSIKTNEHQNRLGGCIKTFAYWDIGFLKEKVLLNPQTGMYSPVSVRKLPDENLNADQYSLPAQRYQVSAEGFVIDVWYSQAGKWLALASTTPEGKRLRYVTVNKVRSL